MILLMQNCGLLLSDVSIESIYFRQSWIFQQQEYNPY